MKTIIQRVSSAEVIIDQKVVGKIGKGLLVLCGFSSSDTKDDLIWMANKIKGLRIFNDQLQNMNLSLVDVGGDILAISQFTLFASTKNGNRPSFIEAAPSAIASEKYDLFIQFLQQNFLGKVQQGVFGAEMQVFLCNDGPVTISIDSKNKN